MRKRVIELTADATLSKNQSGSLIVLNAAAGLVATLPTGGRGLNYEFIVRRKASSGTYTIDAGSNSMEGSILIASASGGADSNRIFYTVDLSARVASMGGSSSGGMIGTNVKVVCDEDGVWHFSGIGIAEAAPTTPFGAS